jgi:hypothetical protein
MAFGVGFSLSRKDFEGLRGSSYLRDLSFYHLVVSSNGIHF